MQAAMEMLLDAKGPLLYAIKEKPRRSGVLVF